MNQDDEKYYEIYFDLFASKGWKQFVEDMKVNYNRNREEIFLGKSEMDYGIFKGRDQMLKMVLGFDNYIKSAYDDIKAHEEEDLESITEHPAHSDHWDD